MNLPSRAKGPRLNWDTSPFLIPRGEEVSPSVVFHPSPFMSLLHQISTVLSNPHTSSFCFSFYTSFIFATVLSQFPLLPLPPLPSQFPVISEFGEDRSVCYPRDPKDASLLQSETTNLQQRVNSLTQEVRYPAETTFNPTVPKGKLVLEYVELVESYCSLSL